MTTNPTAEEIRFASQQITIYVSFLILFGGLFGHAIDILIFTSSKPFRKTPAAFYLTIESIINSLHLLISFTSRIAMSGFNNDLTQTSLVWCKLRAFFGSILTILSLTIVCFAAIDQYLFTSYNPYLKQLSSLKLAHQLVSFAFILWISHGILFLIFSHIESTKGCIVNNRGYVLYLTYVYYLILTGFLPIMITSIFAILAYTNVRRIIRSQIPIVRRRLDKQLTAMILVRVVFLVAMTLPHIIQRIYSLKTSMYPYNAIQQAIVELIQSITYCLFYLNYSGSFYLFLISSARFRRQVKYILFKKYRRICCGNTHGNRISPISHISSVELD